MKSLDLNLNKFKKIHEDNTFAILHHPSGHRIVIAKDNLNNKLKNQLSKLPKMMADGGEVDDESNASVMPSPEDPKSVLNDIEAMPGREQESQMQAVNPIAKLFAPLKGNPEEYQQGLRQTAENIAPIIFEDEQAKENKLTKVPSNYNLGLSRTPAEEMQNMSAQNALSGIQGGFSKERQGFEKEALAQAELGKQEQGIYGDEATQLGNIIKNSQNIANDMRQEHQNLWQDLKDGHVDPDHFMRDKSVLGKIGAAIGLISGGIGGALTGQENPALKFINHQIDRDIEAQRTNLGLKQTLLSDNLKYYGNMMDALNATKANMLALDGARLKEAAAKETSPMARANLLKAAGELDIKEAQISQPLAIRQSLIKTVQEGKADPSIAARVIPDEKDKEAAYKEVDKYHQVESLRKGLKQVFQDLNSRALAGHLSPSDRESALNAFAGPLAKLGEGRFNLEESKNQMKAFLPAGLESDKTRQLKAQRMDQFFDSLASYPVMDSYYPGMLKQKRFTAR